MHKLSGGRKMTEVPSCVDPQVGTVLKTLNYSFNGSSPENKAKFARHLE